MITGVPKKERWWLWAFFLWIFLSGGPVLELVGKPIWIGYFPLLYVWSLLFYVVSVILTIILCYKIKFHTVPEDIISIYDEMQLDPSEDIFKQLQVSQGAREETHG